jgi:MFS family permease
MGGAATVERDASSTVSTTVLGRVLLGFALAMAGNGLLLATLGVRASRAGFSDALTGAVLGVYFVGFLIGARHARRLLERLGAARALVILIAAMALIAAGPALGEVPAWWIVLRLAQGYAISACYVVMETFVNGATGNERRGHLLGVYMVASMTAFALGSLAFRFTGADGRLPFIVAGAITGSGAVVLTGMHLPLTTATVDVTAMPLRLLYRLAPIGVAVGVLVGFANGAFTTVAVYADKANLSDSQTAVISAVVGIGPIVVLYPLSRLSDRVSRPAVLGGSAIVAALLLVAAAAMAPGSAAMVVTLMFAGGLSIALYTLTSAETNDHVTPAQMAGASGQVVLLYGIGAILGPFAAAAAMERGGPDGFFWLNAVSQTAIVITVVVMSAMNDRPRRPPAAGPRNPANDPA